MDKLVKIYKCKKCSKVNIPTTDTNELIEVNCSCGKVMTIKGKKALKDRQNRSMNLIIGDSSKIKAIVQCPECDKAASTRFTDKYVHCLECGYKGPKVLERKKRNKVAK